jgi:hypothetical protein
MSIKINIGCGSSPIRGWLNYDNILSIKLANSPFLYLIAKKMGLLNLRQIKYIKWIKTNNFKYADVTKSIPLKDSTVDCIYSCHMLEHSREEAKKFLNSKNADVFMQDILVKAPLIASLKQKIKLFIIGYRHHQWMHDSESFTKFLIETGFKSVEVCENGYTNIKNHGDLNLYERVDSSVYVEGVN